MLTVCVVLCAIVARALASCLAESKSVGSAYLNALRVFGGVQRPGGSLEVLNRVLVAVRIKHSLVHMYGRNPAVTIENVSCACMQ